MQNQHMIPVGRFSAMLSLVMLVAACAGGGAPTPPGAIGNTPPSILESLPPVDGSTDGSDPFGSPGLTDQSDQTGMPGQTADTAMTDPSLAGLPPATSIPTTANPAPTPDRHLSGSGLTCRIDLRTDGRGTRPGCQRIGNSPWHARGPAGPCPS